MPPRRYRRRGGKSQIDNALAPPFNIYDPHDLPAPIYNGESIIVTSIDPGIKNCGVYVAKINLKSGKVKSLYLSRLEFSGEGSHYINSIKKLDHIEEKTGLFSKSQYIIIEQQMIVSTQNTRMGQHLQTYFLTSLRNKGKRSIIMEFTSKAKTRVLKCPPEKMKQKKDYKKWCAEKAVSILRERDNESEEKYILFLESVKKKDDVGDVICQLEAWKILIDSGIYPYPKPKIEVCKE